MRLLDKIGVVSAAFAVVASVVGGLSFLDMRHAERESEFELRAEIIDLDIKKDAELISYYENKKDLNGLTLPEQRRYNYLQKEIERKIQKKDVIDQKLMEF